MSTQKSLLTLFAVTILLALVACAGGGAPTAAQTQPAAPTSAPAAPTQPPAPSSAPATAATSAPASAATATPAPKPTATAPQPGITAAPGALKIQFWHALTGASQVVQVQKLADKFNAANPTIFVSPSLQGNYDQTHQKVMAAITANSYADLVLGNPGDLADYNTAGAMVPLDDYINDPKDGLTKDQLAEIDQSLYFDRYGGQTLGISIGRSIQVMYYNVDALKAAGFDKPPETFDDLDKVCAAVSKPPDFSCYAFVPGASPFANWDWNFGGQYASADEKTAAFNDAAGVDTLTWLKNQADKKWAYQPSGAFGDQTDFGNGKVEFAIGSTAGLPFYYQAVAGSAKPFNWSIAPIPHGPNGKNYVDIFGPSIGIMKTTPERQKAAWLFLKFLLTKDVEVEWAQVTTYFPATKSAQDAVGAMDPATVSNKSFAAVLPLYKLAVGFLANGKHEPTSPAWQGVRTIIANMVTAVFTGKSGPDFTATDPTGAAKEGVDRVNQALSQYGH
jgi:ABC-type glycerol-3-phosphate transport system substrate-binding protein